MPNLAKPYMKVRMRAAGAVISSTEMMIYELMRSSGSPAFKEMLPHLKG